MDPSFGGARSLLADRGVRLLVLATIAIEIGVWIAIRGYNLADTVEYVKLAEDLVSDGHLLPSERSMRSPAFPFLLAPLVAAVRAFGLDEPRALIAAARGLQLFISLGLVLSAVHVGGRLGGRRVGLTAGALAAINPAFLTFCLDPLSDVTAGILLALGFVHALERGSRGRALRGGVLLGLATIVSYKSMPLVGGLVLVVIARDRWRERRGWLGLLAGYLLVLVLQVALDKAIYGQWGLSLRNYLVWHIANVTPAILNPIGLTEWSKAIVEWAWGLRGHVVEIDAGRLANRFSAHTPVYWYLINIEKYLVFPVLAAMAVAGLHWLLRPSWRRTALFVPLGLFLAALSFKDAKTFRFGIIVLPLTSALCAHGACLALGAARGLPRGAVAVLVVAFFGATGGYSVRQFVRNEPRPYGGYVDAVSWLAAQVPEDESVPFLIDHEFALYYLHPGRFELLPLPTALLDRRVGRPGEAPFPTQAVQYLDRGAWMLVAETTLQSRPALLRLVNRKFRLRAAFDGWANTPALGCVYVLERLPPEAWSEPASFYRSRPDEPPDQIAGLPATVVEVPFAARAEEATDERFVVRAFRHEVLPGGGVVWLDLLVSTPTGLSSQLAFLVRTETADGEERSRQFFLPAHGVVPTADWPAGEAYDLGMRLDLARADLEADASGLRLRLAVVELAGPNDPVGHCPLAPEHAPSAALELAGNEVTLGWLTRP